MEKLYGFSTEFSVPMFPPPAFKSNAAHGVDIESRRMHKEVSGLGGRVWKHTIFSIVFIVPMVMLILMACYGYKLITAMKYMKIDGSEDSYIALMFGVFTMIFGLVYFSFALIVVVELALDLLAWFRNEDNKTFENEEKEQMTICEMIVSTLVIMVSMFMLTYAIYNGYKLAAESRDVIIYNRLPFLVGVLSMGFGFIYFINRIYIVAQSALHLPGKIHHALLDRK
ncbi:hypothetical protein RND81_09G169600 [Saponaria officinalis]|uniref:Uncharacterized protein n=1 Tax=Saponaria officinalis TaxID=3572 RepID=A0AAW1INB1_SAPOF